MTAATLCLLLGSVTAPQVRMAYMVQVTANRPIVPLRAQGKASLVYELQLTNFEKEPLVLKSITAITSKKTLQSLSGEKLAACLVPVGGAEADPTTIGPGKTVVAMMWIDVPKNEVPNIFTHRFTFAKIGERIHWLNGVECKPDRRQLRSFGPPLKGANWIAANAPSNSTGHRRARFAIGCDPKLGQRFAIDYVQIDKAGVTFSGDSTKNESYFCYGQPVIAVADATVVDVVDGIPNNIPNEGISVPLTMKSMPGNHVILNVGGGLYAAYAHLTPGSIRVRRGQKVRRGETLARVGNTGNSSEAHLHFQIMTQPNVLVSEGVPYVQSDAWVQDTKSLGNAVQLIGGERRLVGEMPVDGQCVRFGKK